MQEWVGLIDCNNFFVSCERLFRPDLKDKPVLVLSSNDGCVVARSQEIKDKGIPMGVPYFHIKDIIKDIGAVTFSSHFALYRDVSRRVFEVVRREMDAMQQYSIDEAFFRLAGSEAEVFERSRLLKDTVEREVGIPVSIGVSLSKTQAKCASKRAKKTGGVCVLSADVWKELSLEIPLADIWGVGKQTTSSFARHGLRTVADLVQLERRQIVALFGVVGERLWLELQGVPTVSLLRRQEHQKSILNSRSFKNTSSDISVLHDAVAYHVREASEDLRSMGLKAGDIQVTLGTSRHGDYFMQGGSAALHFELATDDTFVLLKAAAELVERVYVPHVPYKKAGILLFNLTAHAEDQLSIFGDGTPSKTAELMPLLDALNHGNKHALLLGSHLQTKQWQSSQESRSPAYTTSWKDIAVVKT